MPKSDLDTREYWEGRLARQTNLQGTGHRAFSLDTNYWLYHAQHECLDQVLEQNHVQVNGAKVLDVGSGTGYWVDYYLKRQAAAVTGVDLTVTSRQYLKENFPTGVFFTADISEPELPFGGSFDIISAMGVLYHIVDEARFQQALNNLSNLLNPGGFLIISDAFQAPLLPAARHARLRSLEEYRPILTANQMKIIDLLPVYYLANRTFIPVIGPWVINRLKLGKFFYNLDNRLRSRKLSNGTGLKTLLARKETGAG